jgi:hypothetical protein
MKITKKQLKRIIKEELEAALSEFKFTQPEQAKDISLKPGMALGLDAKRRCGELAQWYQQISHDAMGYSDGGTPTRPTQPRMPIDHGGEMQKLKKQMEEIEAEWKHLKCDPTTWQGAEYNK